MSDSFKMSFEPTRDKHTLRRQLQAERLAMADRHQRSMHLQEVLRVWLVSRSERSIGAYWPIKGEFDALPALFRWSEADADRRIGLPVIDRDTKQLRFHVWYPGCPMEEDAYGIPKPKDTEAFEPAAAAGALRGLRPEGAAPGLWRRLLRPHAGRLAAAPFTVGVGYAHGFVPWLQAEPHDVPLDAMLDRRTACVCAGAALKRGLRRCSAAGAAQAARHISSVSADWFSV